MNIFLKVGIFLMCEPEISDNTASNDLESGEISEENPIIDEFALKKWGTRQGVIDVALGGNHSEKSDGERWGAREGIIEVAGEEFVDERTPLERWGTREGVMEVDFGQEREQKYLKRILKLRKLQFQAESARNKRLRKHDVIQIVINNTSDKERGITFWGNGIPVSPPLAEDIEDHHVISKTPVGVHPQGVIVNPFNAFIYVANQLSDSVSITRIDGVLIKTVQLLQVGYPGTYSPTHLAVHSKAESSGYGKVYVAGSVANSVSVIDTNNEVTKVIPVGIRPVGIAFNPVNERIYVANLVSNTISVISTTTDEVIETLPAQPGCPWQLSINTVNGDIYILYRRTGKIQIWNVSHTLVFESNAIAEPVSLAWNPEANRMYVVSIANDQINAIEADTHILLAPVPTGHRPYAIAFHPGNKFIYVANTEDGTISIVDSANTLRGTIPSNGINAGLAVHPQNVVVWSNTGSQLVEAAGFAQETSAIQTDYNRLSDDQNYFHYNPATLEHIRFVVSGERSVKKLTVTHATISGKKTDTAISLTNYESPQHFSKVYEIDTIKGTILDGNSRWRFTMPPLQTVTLLIYYRPTSRELFFKKSLNNGVKQKIC